LSLNLHKARCGKKAYKKYGCQKWKNMLISAKTISKNCLKPPNVISLCLPNLKTQIKRLTLKREQWFLFKERVKSEQEFGPDPRV
jgi:hypothetical protein